MIENLILMFLAGIGLSWIIFGRKTNDAEETISGYALGKKLVEDFVEMYVTSKILPKLNVPNYTFTAEELDLERKKCIEYVLENINKSNIAKHIRKVFSDETLALYADYIFTQKVSSLRAIYRGA